MQYLRNQTARFGVSGRQQSFAQQPEFQISFTGDDEIRESYNWLCLRFVTHLRTAQHHDDIRSDLFEISNQSQCLVDIPDINSKAHDPRSFTQNRGQNILKVIVDCELADD